jgi:hypothetical protein
MNEELTKSLYEKYPEIFAEHHLSPQETCMCFGFECDEGWYPLIDELCSRLSRIAKQYNIDIVARQVKEKYGKLIFNCNYSYGSKWKLYIPWYYGIAKFIGKITHTSKYTKRLSYWMFDGQKYIKTERPLYSSFKPMPAFSGVQSLLEETVMMFEDFSGMICEVCGKPAKLFWKDHWCKTLCEDHKKELKFIS